MLEDRPDENQLLAALPAEEYARLRPHLEHIRLVARDAVIMADTPITHIHFPRTAVLSMVLDLEDGGAVEVATVGNEGMVGLPIFFGADQCPTRTFCQVAGEALRIEAAAFREAVDRRGPFDNLVRRYAQAAFNQVAQTSACNRLHSVEQRLCRWLLMTHDRVRSDRLPLTQEFLALMLGVQRPSVSVVAALLQRAGLIRYARGLVDVLDREGLEAASCGCYRAVRRELERLLS